MTMARWQQRTLGVLTLGGGAVGFSTALEHLLETRNPVVWVIVGLAMLAYAWGIWIGIRVLEGSPRSAQIALPYWLIQVPTFSSPIAGYFFTSGFHSTLAFEFVPLKLNASFLLGSTFTYSLFSSDKPWSLGVNLFAAVVAFLLYKKAYPKTPADPLRPEVDVS